MSWSEIKKSLNSKLGTANDRALDVQLDELKTTVGATADAAGSATTGTVMGKLRWLIEQLTTTRNNVATNNTASATGILSQKLSWIGNTLIGATNNSGATATSGTVMGKLNGLLTGGSITFVDLTTQSERTRIFTASRLCFCSVQNYDKDKSMSIYVNNEPVYIQQLTSNTDGRLYVYHAFFVIHKSDYISYTSASDSANIMIVQL